MCASSLIFGYKLALAYVREGISREVWRVNRGNPPEAEKLVLKNIIIFKSCIIHKLERKTSKLGVKIYILHLIFAKNQKEILIHIFVAFFAKTGKSFSAG